MIEFGLLFAKGFALGFVWALILGPIGIFCIQQTLRKGFSAGFAAGLGVATADGVYSAIAGLGLTFIDDFLLNYQIVLHIIGGTFLTYLGLKTLLRKESPVNLSVPQRANIFGLYATTFILTLANPINILIFTVLLSLLGIDTDDCGTPLAATLFASVFLGSGLAWLLLTTSISTFRSKISMPVIQQLNRVAGSAIAVFGFLILLKALFKFLM